MSRRFSAANDEVRYPVQAGSNFTAAWSVAVWVRRASATNQWQAVLGHHDSSGNYACGFEFAALVPHAVAPYNHASTQYSTTTFQSSDGWGLIVVTKTSGSTTPRIHFYKGGSWTHENASGGFANANSQASGSIRLGELADSDDFDGYIAADAGWASALSDLQAEALTADMSTWVTHAVPPVYCHQHTQALATDTITDLMGNGHDASGTISGTTDSTGIAGTSIDASNPSGWTPYSPSGDQTITPGTISAGSQLFAPTLAPGAVTITPGTIAATSQVFGPALAQIVAPGFLASGSQLFAPTLTPGSVTIQPGFLASGSQVFAPSTDGSLAISPGFLASGSQVFAPSLAVGSINATPGFLASGAQVFQPALSGGDPGLPQVTAWIGRHAPHIQLPGTFTVGRRR